MSIWPLLSKKHMKTRTIKSLEIKIMSQAEILHSQPAQLFLTESALLQVLQSA